MAKFDPFLSLDCARVEGVGRNPGNPIVKQSMTDLVPNSMKMIGEALISIGRIEAFLGRVGNS